MDDNELNITARRLEKEAEAQETGALSRELNSFSIEDRLALARAMEAINDRRREANHDLPILEIGTTRDAAGREHLEAVDMKFEKSWFNPGKYLFGKYSVVDVYQPPALELGSGLLQQAADGIRDHNRELSEAERMLAGK